MFPVHLHEWKTVLACTTWPYSWLEIGTCDLNPDSKQNCSGPSLDLLKTNTENQRTSPAAYRSRPHFLRSLLRTWTTAEDCTSMQRNFGFFLHVLVVVVVVSVVVPVVVVVAVVVVVVVDDVVLVGVVVVVVVVVVSVVVPVVVVVAVVLVVVVVVVLAVVAVVVVVAAAAAGVVVVGFAWELLL